ncbi:MAG: AAA family ATPase [Candidatus Niyogibacteria bacterium]|nr:AAA family ATPase [Candidatus Niyogibacteria bacterium]
MTQNEALNILKTGANVFLTGEPGAGKTHTVNKFVNYLRSCGVEPAVTASTGIAATHINGMTIHSWSGIGVKKFLSEYDLEEIAGKERVVKRLRAATTLIIDEVSMLDGRTLAMVDQVCRTVKNSEHPFGGLQVVLVGDFFQLPPIARDGETSQFAFESIVWQSANPIVCYLSEQYRQEDAEFLEILSALRSGNVTSRHKECLLKRCAAIDDKNNAGSHADIPKLFPHNADVDRINSAELAKLSSPARNFVMTGRGNPLLIEQLKRGCLSPETLILKKGSRVMFTKNSFDGKFVNGTTGEVVGFTSNGGVPLVKTRNGRTVAVEPAEWGIETDGKVLAKVIQVPLRLAWAITVHKSQGMSLDAAFIDLSTTFEFGQGYVALSRVRTLNGLYLGGLNDKAFQVHDRVLAQDFKFRAASLEAQETFGEMAPAKFAKLWMDFLNVSGGKPGVGPKLKHKGRVKGGSLEETLKLLKLGKNLATIATARGLAETTIIGHLEKLHSQEKLSAENMAHLGHGKEREIAEVNAVFHKLATERLTPVFEHFSGRYSYEFIRLARLLNTR